MRKKVHDLLRKTIVQVLIYHKSPKSSTTYRDFKLSRCYSRFSECSEDSKKYRVSFMRQVESRLPSQTVLSILVVFLDIRSAAVAIDGNYRVIALF